jgi:hypothetical protein
MTIKTVEKIDNLIVVLVDGGGGFILSPFGNKDVYSIVSDNILKSAITQYKLDALENNFNLNKLKKIWLQE